MPESRAEPCPAPPPDGPAADALAPAPAPAPATATATAPDAWPLSRPVAAWLAADALRLLAVMVGQVAVPWLVAQHGGAADLARYGVVLSLVTLLAMPLLSPLGDRHAKARLIRGGLAGAALSSTLLAAAWALRGYDLLTVVLLQSVAALGLTVAQSASNALAAELAPPTALTRVLGWQQGAQAAGRLVGPAMAGAVLAAFGGDAALGASALLLAAAAASVGSRMPRSLAARPRAPWWTEVREGLRIAWAVPLERGWTLCNLVAWIFLFPALTLLVPLKVQSLGLSGLWLGLCEAGLSLGLLAGSLGGAQALIHRFGRYRMRLIGAVLQGLALAVAGLTERPLLLVALFVLTGFANSTSSLVGMTHRLLARPLAYRARLSAAAVTMTQVAASLGPGLAGLALSAVPVGVVFAGFGLLGALASASLALVPGFRAFMAMSPVEVEGWYARRWPQAFRP